MGEARVPTFLLLGAAKCGTSSLAYYLSQHPDIFFSEPKEPIFFEAEYEKGLDYYWRRYFSGWGGEKAIGEGRVWNLYLPFVAPRIRASLPQARLIALLRDPVERAFSHWWHRRSRGQETLDFAEAVACDRARVERGERFEAEAGAELWRSGLHNQSTSHRVLLDSGFYAEQIERYRALFPSSQLKVVFYDDLVSDPDRVVREVCGFLGVSPVRTLVDSTPQNPGRERVRSATALRVLLAARASRLRHLVPQAYRSRLFGALFERPGRRPDLDPGLRRELMAYFEPHTRRLEQLTDRDLSTWRETGSG
jgi:hypothetical protein